MLPPGSTIGMLGGGQLGRMAALAAARLGYHVHVFTPETDSPAAEVSLQATMAAWDDRTALESFAKAVDVITLEFENVPLDTIHILAALKPVFPDAAALAVSQDRIREKTFLNELGIETAPWVAVETADALAPALEKIGTPAFLKTARLGYDGKGQIKIEAGTASETLWEKLGNVPLILEAGIAFEREVSLVLTRGQDGALAFYPLVENRHEHGILAETIAPAHISQAITKNAQAIARKIVEALDYVGVLAVEFFLTREGTLLVNEIAPRPHNSGHWTIDACAVSQFEQQLRATCGLPLGSTERHSDAVMRNLIGDAVNDWPRLVSDPSLHLHLYGKKEARPGRKMGHVTQLLPLRNR